MKKKAAGKAPSRPPFKKMKTWVRQHSVLTFLMATAALLILVHFYMALFAPPSKEKVWKEIQVTEGMSFKAIAARSRKKGSSATAAISRSSARCRASAGRSASGITD